MALTVAASLVEELAQDSTENASTESAYGTLANGRVVIAASDQLGHDGKPMLGLRLGVDMFGGDIVSAYGGLDRLLRSSIASHKKASSAGNASFELRVFGLPISVSRLHQ